MPQYANIVAYRLRDFTKINTPIFFRSKFDEDPQDFLDEVYRIPYAMGVT